MRVISDQDHTFFNEHGYVIVQKAVPQSDLDALLNMIDQCVGLAASTWYKPPHHSGSFVEAYQQQALWNTRQQPRVYQAFADLHGTHKVGVGIDRCSMKLPWRKEHGEFGDALPMHWDVDFRDHEITLGLQGVLAVTDTDETMGGFACVPGSHRRIKEIIARQPADHPNPMRPDLGEDQPVAIPMNAGDLLLWHVGLLHGSLRNNSDRPRFAQYIKMHPSRADAAARKKQAQRFQSMQGHGFEKTNDRIIPPDQPPTLTPLGRKIAGIDAWD